MVHDVREEDMHSDHTDHAMHEVDEETTNTTDNLSQRQDVEQSDGGSAGTC